MASIKKSCFILSLLFFKIEDSFVIHLFVSWDEKPVAEAKSTILAHINSASGWPRLSDLRGFTKRGTGRKEGLSECSSGGRGRRATAAGKAGGPPDNVVKKGW
jgi:hypothetical protein